MIKRDNWTNDEVIALLKGCKVVTDDGETEENFALDQAIFLFYDMKMLPERSYSAKALDTETGRVVCVGLKLPQ